MRKLLWIGDAACPSGFARSTHGVLETLHKTWDVTVLGMNYRGDPHKYPYPIYAAAPGGDSAGIGRLLWMMDSVKPDLVVIQQDPWNFPAYMKVLRKAKEYNDIPVVGDVAVDGLNCRGTALNDLAHCVFWTKFGRDEAQKGGFKKPSSIIPLGVDLNTFRPAPRNIARQILKFPAEIKDFFIVGNVNRNQPRKRLDLTIKYFAEWVKQYKIDDAALYLHVAPTGDDAYDLQNLADYYGVKYLLTQEPAMFYGISEEGMRATYCSLDLLASTTQGEGFGFSSFESMACGIPNIVPGWSALGELLSGAACMIPCTTTIATEMRINSIGGVADEHLFVEALQHLYTDATYRRELANKGLQLVKEEQYNWANIGKKWEETLDFVMAGSAPYQMEAANVQRLSHYR